MSDDDKLCGIAKQYLLDWEFIPPEGEGARCMIYLTDCRGSSLITSTPFGVGATDEDGKILVHMGDYGSECDARKAFADAVRQWWPSESQPRLSDELRRMAHDMRRALDDADSVTRQEVYRILGGEPFSTQINADGARTRLTGWLLRVPPASFREAPCAPK